MPKSPSTVLDLETRLALMRALEDNPRLSQRELAEQVGVSLGKTNYCLRALIEKGHVKAGNFKSNPKKTQYMYQLTPQGLAAKAQITARFLKRKLEEHEARRRDAAPSPSHDARQCMAPWPGLSAGRGRG
jgi:EPS-associated MarR family transcriptional regulator